MDPNYDGCVCNWCAECDQRHRAEEAEKALENAEWLLARADKRVKDLEARMSQDTDISSACERVARPVWNWEGQHHGGTACGNIAFAQAQVELAAIKAAGIREGLERAAALCEREAEACRGHQRALADVKKRVSVSAMHECAAKQNDACARYIRALKEQVK